MSVRRSVLWITPQPPHTVVGGGGIRQAYFLRALAEAADVDLLVAGPEPLTDEDVRGMCRSVIECAAVPRDVQSGTVRKGTISARLTYLRSALGPEGPGEVYVARNAARLVGAELRRLDAANAYDAVVVQHAAFSRLLPKQRRGRWVCELDRLGSIDMHQLKDITTGARQRWLYGREEAAYRRLERWIGNSYDSVIGVSDEDLAAVPGRTIAIANGVDTARFTASPLPAAPKLVMTGYLGTPPNVTGALWLCREVLPIVQAAVPAATLEIVGGAPTDEVRRLGDLPGVAVHADVPDIVPYLSAARVAVVPLVMGSGTRLKALEAFAAGRPVAGTSIGLTGLGVADGTGALIGDSPSDLAERIVRLLDDDGLAAKLVTDGLAIAGRHDWRALGDGYVAAVFGDAASSID
ncbi:MAG TPA: glycosyltransferase family 4 protein [Mycobacteriales bacterium]|nr:glycosyltransferase family 4 protein [Mycobacteriales bacterium]